MLMKFEAGRYVIVAQPWHVRGLASDLAPRPRKCLETAKSKTIHNLKAERRSSSKQQKATNGVETHMGHMTSAIMMSELLSSLLFSMA